MPCPVPQHTLQHGAITNDGDPMDPSRTIATALDKRPEVSQRKLDIDRANFDVRVAKDDRSRCTGLGSAGADERTTARALSFRPGR